MVIIMMEDKLRRHVDGLFSETAPTRRAVELKEEMIQNLQDKYSDLIAEGKTPESAYNIAVAGIGDVSGLLEGLCEPEPMITDEAYEMAQHKSALLTAVAIMLYIVSFLPLLILSFTSVRNPEEIGAPIMFAIIAAATGLLVYTRMTKPKGRKQADTMVEEFREWQRQSGDRRTLRRSLSAAMWSIILVLYFVISFLTMAWYITWIIFLLGIAAEAIINIFWHLKK